MKINKTKVYDTVLISVTIIVALLIAFFFRPSNEPGICVSVKVDGKEVSSYPLNKDAKYILNNGTNTLVVKDGYAMITEANCPDHVCVNQGKINCSGQSIVCLPNKLVVTIEISYKGVDLVL